MTNFLLKIWEDIEEIIIHLVSSTIVMFLSVLCFSSVGFIVKYVFPKENYLITLMETASQGTILALFLVYVVKSLIRALKKING
jgi:hypothetical protein